MGNSFSKIPVAVQERSNQNLSHPAFITSDFGRLDVLYCNSDIVPGDDVNLNIDGFLRGAPMPAPTEGKIDIDVRVFFVPHRILCNRENEANTSSFFSWDNWITGVSSNAHPYILGQALVNRINENLDEYIGVPYDNDLRRLYGELGFPTAVIRWGSDTTRYPVFRTQRFNPFRFYAYQRIWWDWYRDSSLIDESLIRDYVPICGLGQVSAADALKILRPQYCCFKKDYFTTAKLNPQSGTRTVVAPSGIRIQDGFNNHAVVPSGILETTPGLLSASLSDSTGNSAHLPVQWLRAANALQKYLERNNLAGSRLMERFLARFGNTPSSVALDMSEYLGGASRSLQIGDITSNNEQDGISEASITNAFGTPSSSRGTIQGQLGGKSAADVSSGSISFHSKEFGTLMAILTIKPSTFYYQGIDRSLTRGVNNDKFDYFTPEMENLGYQPLYTREVALSSTSDANSQIFGYVPRYSDYKFARGVVAGDFVLPGTSAGMDSWYLGRDLEREFSTVAPDGSLVPSLPVLSPAFTTISPYPRLLFDRIFSIPGNVGQYDHFNVFANCEVHMSRPMSASSLPSLDEDLGQHGNVVSVPNGGVRM